MRFLTKQKKKPQGGHSSGWDVCEGEKRKEKQRSGQIGGNYPCCFTALCSSARPLVRCLLAHLHEWQVQQGTERKRLASLVLTHTRGMSSEPNWQAIGAVLGGASLWAFAWLFFKGKQLGVLYGVINCYTSSFNPIITNSSLYICCSFSPSCSLLSRQTGFKNTIKWLLQPAIPLTLVSLLLSLSLPIPL